MSKDRFMFFRNIRDVINSAETPEEKMQVFDAICDYAFDEIEPTDKWLKMVVQSLKPTLDYKGVGAPKGNKNAQKTIKTIKTITNNENNENNSKQLKQLQTIKQETETETETETITPIILPQDKSFGNIPPLVREQKKVNKFVPPTLEEVDTYIAEKNLSVNGRDFFEYFETGNWIDSKGQKVKNWKQKLLTWDKNGIGKRGKIEKPDLVQQNRANLWAFVQDSGVKI